MKMSNAELIATARLRAEKYSSGSDEYVINLLIDALEAAEAERDAALTTTETPEQIRDRLLPVVLSYAAAEGLSDLGKVQAALRLGAQAGIQSVASQELRTALIDAEDERDKALGLIASGLITARVERDQALAVIADLATTLPEVLDAAESDVRATDDGIMAIDAVRAILAQATP